MVLAAFLTYALDSARESFELLMSVGAGTGLIYLLRWFWWRINAWSEIAAMASSFLVAVGFFIAAKLGSQIPSHISLLVTIAVTTVVWVSTTYLTKPADRATLVRFYRLVRPAGPGWKQLRAETGLPPSPDSLPQAFLGWIAGCVFVYSALFGAGSLLYGRRAQAAIWIVLFLISTWYLSRLLPKMWSSSSDDADERPILARVGVEADE